MDEILLVSDSYLLSLPKIILTHDMLEVSICIMSPIEKAARRLCHAQGEDEDNLSAGAPRWAAYLPQVMAVIDALHEPDRAMQEAGLEIIRYVGRDESELGYQSDAANVWRFMIDSLHQDGRHLIAKITDRPVP